MSRNRDVKQMLDLADSKGLEIVKRHHGGYSVLDAHGATIARLPVSGKGRTRWLSKAREAIERQPGGGRDG